MRGASALDDALAATTDVPVAALVVWLPVLAADHVPLWRPKRRSFADPRVWQTWDPERAVSEHLLGLARAHREWLSEDEQGSVDDADAIVWDVVMIWPPGARWEELPAAAFHATPVVRAADELATEIRRATR